MFIKREGKEDCVIAGMAVGDMKEKEYDGKKFYEVGISMGKDAGIVNVAIWNRKPEEIKKLDRIFACGQLKVQKVDKDGETKTYYTLNADFIIKEKTVVEEKNPDIHSESAEDNLDDLPF